MNDAGVVPPEVELLTHGYQYLTEQRYDQLVTTRRETLSSLFGRKVRKE